MRFKHLWLSSSAALHNACLLKINRHLVANLKASQALKSGNVHANLKPQGSCCQCTTYAQQSCNWSNHPEERDHKYRVCCLNRNLAVILFLTCFSFNHVDLACQAEVWQGKYSHLPSLPPLPTGRVCNAVSGNASLSPFHLKEVSNPDHPLLGPVS